jgi:ParB/RepB/Spo0J family partition protein
VKTITVDGLVDPGAFKAALSLAALTDPRTDLVPIVKTLEVQGRRFTVTSVGVDCAEAYELLNPVRVIGTGAKEGKGAFAGRRAKHRGVEYVLVGPFRLVAAESETPGGPEPAADVREFIAQEAQALVLAAAIERPGVAAMQAEVDAEIAAARARVDAATPEQLAEKREPLPDHSKTLRVPAERINTEWGAVGADIAATYSADIIDGNGKQGRIKRPARVGDLLVVCMGFGAQPKGTLDVWRVIPREEWTGPTWTFVEKMRLDPDHVRSGETARNDPLGFYHGMTAKAGGKEWVIVGPQIRLIAEKEAPPIAAALPGPVAVMPAALEAELIADREEALRNALAMALIREAGWQALRAAGATDAELREHVGAAIGHQKGGFIHAGTTAARRWFAKGYTRPRLWLDHRDEEDMAVPDLQGRALVQMARELLEIPEPVPTDDALRRAATTDLIAAGKKRAKRAAAQNAPSSAQPVAVVALPASAASDTPQGEKWAHCMACRATVPWDHLLCDACEAIKRGGASPMTVHQAARDAALQAIAAGAEVVPEPELTAETVPDIVCHRCGEELHDGEEPDDEGHATNWNHAANRAHNIDPLTCDDCRSAVATERVFGLRAVAAAKLVPVDRSPYTEIPLGWIRPSPHNPREAMEDEALRELAASIRAVGVLQPLLVRELPPGEGFPFELIAGERRLRAAGIAALTYVPAIVSEIRTEAEILTAQLVENLMREDLNAVEVARGYKQLTDAGMTQAQIALEVGKSQPTVANYLRMLELPAEVLDHIAAGELTAAHGRALVKWAAWPAVVAQIAKIAAGHRAANKHTGTVKYLETELLPFAWPLESAKLVKEMMYGVAFDVTQCEQCPFGAYLARGGMRYCLRPEHYHELQNAAIADATARAKEAQAALEEQRRVMTTRAAEGPLPAPAMAPPLLEAGAKGGATAAAPAPVEDEQDEELQRLSIPRIADLPHGSLVVLGQDSPCRWSDCPCRGMALDRTGEPVPVCLDSDRYHARLRERRALEQQERVIAIGRLRAEALQAREADPGAEQRALVLIVCEVAQRVGLHGARIVTEQMGLALDCEELASGFITAERKRPLWEAMALLEPRQLMDLAARLIIESDLYRAEQYGYEPVAVEYLAGHAAPVAEDQAGERTCRQCGDTVSAEGAMESWATDTLCMKCAELLEGAGLLDDEGNDVEARTCDDCGERIGAQLAECPLCAATEGVTEAVA